jgi:uncharacterized damage-inducible protein DinB
MTTDEAAELFAYGSWATARMIRAVETLTQEQLEAVGTSAFPSVLATIAHIVGAEWIWLRRWLGESPASAPVWASTRSLAELKAQLAALEQERGSFLGRVTSADLERVISYRGSDGQTFAHPLGQLVRHVVNHSTYHRGQLSTQLRQLGCTPPNTDFTRYLREGQ